MNVAITSSSSVEEVVEFLEGKGLGEITDKLTGKRPLFRSSVIQFISDLSFRFRRIALKLLPIRKRCTRVIKFS